MAGKLLSLSEVARVRARVTQAVTVLQKKDPSLQLVIETLTELGDDLLSEIQEFDDRTETENNRFVALVLAERLVDDTGEPEDIAYNRALDDVLEAIREER